MTSLADLLNDSAKYNDKAICDFVSKHPASCRVQSEWSWQGNKFETTAFPLTRISMLNASLMAVVLAYNAFPDAVRKVDSKYGATPLYFACLNPCFLQPPLAVVRFLINEYPDGIKQKAKCGELPLHAACRRGTPSLEVVQLLLFLYPESVDAKKTGGFTPLQVAQKEGKASKEVIDFLEIATSIKERLGKFPTTRRELDVMISEYEELYAPAKSSKDSKVVIEGIVTEQILVSLAAFRKYLPTREELQQKLDTVNQAMEDETLDLVSRLSLTLEYSELHNRIEKEGTCPAPKVTEEPEVVAMN